MNYPLRVLFCEGRRVCVCLCVCILLRFSRRQAIPPPPEPPVCPTGSLPPPQGCPLQPRWPNMLGTEPPEGLPLTGRSATFWQRSGRRLEEGCHCLGLVKGLCGPAVLPQGPLPPEPQSRFPATTALVSVKQELREASVLGFGRLSAGTWLKSPVYVHPLLSGGFGEPLTFLLKVAWNQLLRLSVQPQSGPVLVNSLASSLSPFCSRKSNYTHGFVSSELLLKV